MHRKYVNKMIVALTAAIEDFIAKAKRPNAFVAAANLFYSKTEFRFH